MTLAYVKERKQFGVPVGSFQAVAHRCAQMLLDTESGALGDATSPPGRPTPTPERLAEAAALAAAAAADARPRRHRAARSRPHGGIGFTWEADVHWLYKRAQLDARAARRRPAPPRPRWRGSRPRRSACRPEHGGRGDGAGGVRSRLVAWPYAAVHGDRRSGRGGVGTRRRPAWVRVLAELAGDAAAARAGPRSSGAAAGAAGRRAPPAAAGRPLRRLAGTTRAWPPSTPPAPAAGRRTSRGSGARDGPVGAACSRRSTPYTRTSGRCCPRCPTRRCRSCGTGRAAPAWPPRAPRSTTAARVRARFGRPLAERAGTRLRLRLGAAARFFARDVAPGRLCGCDPVQGILDVCRETRVPADCGGRRSCRTRCRSTSRSTSRTRSRSSPTCPRRGRALPRRPARGTRPGRDLVVTVRPLEYLRFDAAMNGLLAAHGDRLHEPLHLFAPHPPDRATRSSTARR